MNANSLHIDLPSDERPSLIPWIIVLACVAILLVQLSQLASQIPAKLIEQAQSQLDTSVYPDVKIVGNGRDMELSGNIIVGQSAAPLVERLNQISGIRQVNVALQVVDPAVEEQEQLARFVQNLSTIDATTVAFQPGSTSFTPESDNALAQLLQLLKQHPEGRVRIEGHTDNTGSDTVNLRVSRDRAAAVANYLMARGIPADQLIVTGYGSTQPIASNTTDSGRSRNRRIEIYPVN